MTATTQANLSSGREHRGRGAAILNFGRAKPGPARVYKRLGLSRKRINYILLSVIEPMDPELAEHQMRTADLALAIAREMGLDERRSGEVYTGALLHDIGRIFIPRAMNAKRATGKEALAHIVRHPLDGYKLLVNTDLPREVKEIILRHHERLDGSGYPGGLRGSSIPRGARIVAVADFMDSMLTETGCPHTKDPYSRGDESGPREGRTPGRILRELIAGSGILYDSEATAACLRLFKSP